MCCNTLQQKTNAKSVLLHHRDIQDLLQVCLCIPPDSPFTTVQGGEGGLSQRLAESGVTERVEIDENGGEVCSRRINFPVFTLGSWTTGQARSGRIPRADLAKSRAGDCQRYRGLLEETRADPGIGRRCKCPCTLKGVVFMGRPPGRHPRSEAPGE